jgi:hypothetical protein
MAEKVHACMEQNSMQAWRESQSKHGAKLDASMEPSSMLRWSDAQCQHGRWLQRSIENLSMLALSFPLNCVGDFPTRAAVFSLIEDGQ